MYHFSEESLKILLSIIIGAFIGMEREYRGKAAGFRTIILISLGSTLFTIVSIKLGGINNADRIAANIITGIGFLGAGVVFRDNFSITGITTATVIWVTAALGMTIGIGEYKLAIEGFILVLIVLSVFEYIQDQIAKIHQKRSYKISFDSNILQADNIENELKERKLDYTKKKEMKTNDEIICFYDVYGSIKKFDDFNSYLMNNIKINSFEC